jgi:peptide/nickel transport system permease protein
VSASRIAGAPRRSRGALGPILRKPAFTVGGSIVAFLVFVALFGPLLVHADPFSMNIQQRLQAPSIHHWFGTDEFGRDVFTRVVYGSRITLRIGFISVAIGFLGGGLIGLQAGYLGGWVDLALMAFIDLLFAFPAILLALAIIAVMGPGLTNTMIAVGVATAPSFARVIRGSTLEIRERVYVEAARALGAPHWRLLARHIGANIVSPVLVLVTLQFPAALLSAAALGFIGLGAQPPQPEWGAMLVSARNYLQRAPWMVNAPGFAIMLTVLGFNLIGNALRDVMDPTQRGA